VAVFSSYFRSIFAFSWSIYAGSSWYQNSAILFNVLVFCLFQRFF